MFRKNKRDECYWIAVKSSVRSKARTECIPEMLLCCFLINSCAPDVPVRPLAETVYQRVVQNHADTSGVTG
jgi:hypothetical protein